MRINETSHPKKHVSGRGCFPDLFWRQIQDLLERGKLATGRSMMQHAFELSNDNSPSLVHVS